MRGRWLSPLMIGFLVLTGCRKPGPPDDFSKTYELKTEIILNHHWATIRRLTIRGQGNRTFELGPWGGLGGVDLSGGTEPAIEVFIVAMLDPGYKSLTCWVTGFALEDGKRVAGGTGAPSMIQVNLLQQPYLPSIIQWNEVSGRHAYGEEIRLGDFLISLPNAPRLTMVVK
jgi:hypothetical protein